MGIRSFFLAITVPIGAIWLLRDHPAAFSQISNLLTMSRSNPTS